MLPIPLRTPRRLAELCSAEGGELDAPLADRLITAVAGPEAALSAGDLTLVVSKFGLGALKDGDAPVLVAPRLAHRVATGRRWVHEAPWWAFASVLEQAEPAWRKMEVPRIAPDASLAPSAIVHQGAVIGEGCRLEPHAVVYGGVVLGARVVVGAGSVIGRSGFGFAHGARGSTRRIPQLGGVLIGDDVEVGALCSIDSGTLGPTSVGAGTKLDAQVHIGHNAKVGERCFIAAQVGLAGSVELGNDVWVGGQAGIADHIRVGSGARIAAKSGVISDVAEGDTVAGYPAVERWRWLRRMGWLFRSKGIRA
jgi:UDP-3-O-[3-hydroxymyristoyl] glucosamine N-acyltransferase